MPCSSARAAAGHFHAVAPPSLRLKSQQIARHIHPMPSHSTSSSLTDLPARPWGTRLPGGKCIIALVAAFAAVTYMTVFMAFLVPDEGVNARWSRGKLVIDSVLPGHPAAALLQPGDVLLAIDGTPAHLHPFRPLFWPVKAVYRYDILRNDAVVTLDVPLPPANLGLIGQRLVTSIVAYASLALAAILVLAARRQREAATLVALILFAAVVVVATDAQVYNVPGAALIGDPLLPLAAVAFAQVALVPSLGDTSRTWRTVLIVLYVIAALLGMATLHDVLFLRPQGTTLLAGWIVPWLMVLEAFVAVALVTNVLILISRLRRETNPYHRRQTIIVLAATAVALFPLVFLSLLPTVLFGQEFMPWSISLLMLLLIPLAYAYVIVRHKFLGLDVQVTRLLTLVLGALAVVLLYMVFYFVLVRLPALRALEPLPTTLYLVLATTVIVPTVGRSFRHGTERVLFGPDAGLETALVDFTQRLSAAPTLDTMAQVVAEVGRLLEVERLLLLVTGFDGKVHTLSHPASSETPWQEALRQLPDRLLVKAAHVDPIFDLYPWPEAIRALQAQEEYVGSLLVGRRLDGGYFDGRQEMFIEQVAQIFAVTGSVFRLVESIRSLTKDIVTVRDLERLQLSMRLHDEPLQVMAMASRTLQQALEVTQPAAEGRHEMESSLASMREAARQLREICTGLYPPAVNEGVPSIIKGLVRDFRQQTGVRVDLNIVLQGDTVGTELRRAIYHVLRESLSNVAKHAEASQVEIDIEQVGDNLQLRVADNGSGLPSGLPPSSERLQEKRFGILNMEQWSILVNGLLQIADRPEGGTMVSFTAPLSSTSAGAGEAIGADATSGTPE